MLSTQVESLQKVDKKQRQKEILNLLELYPSGLTAREIAVKLGYIERNATAPRLNELEWNFKVMRLGKRYDEITKRSVTVYCLERRCQKCL